MTFSTYVKNNKEHLCEKYIYSVTQQIHIECPLFARHYFGNRTVKQIRDTCPYRIYNPVGDK